jgi:hypothetical protein
MLHFAHRPKLADAPPTARPKTIACPLCHGSNTRLINKAQANAARSAPVVGVCGDCKHFWAAATIG